MRSRYRSDSHDGVRMRSDISVGAVCDEKLQFPPVRCVFQAKITARQAHPREFPGAGTDGA